MRVTEKAYAKINLALDVLGKRPDGYHEVKMIMQTLDLADDVKIAVSDRLEVFTDCPNLPGGEGNIAFSAACVMARVAACPPNVKINIKKRIPVAAGLAGGSSDAAAVLRGLNTVWHLNWPAEKLREIAAEIGADVPFCIEGGTALATGRGEIINQLADCPDMFMVLACPDIEVSTAWVYKNFSRAMVLDPPDVDAAAAELAAGDIEGMVSFLRNVLELVTIKRYPVIEDIKIAMLQAGARASLMTGSGPAVFALAAGQSAARAIAEKTKGLTGADTWITRTRRRREIL